ncbi:hypothetical protein JCM3765_001124 [Sporobolomyces pararoseus]
MVSPPRSPPLSNYPSFNPVPPIPYSFAITRLKITNPNKTTTEWEVSDTSRGVLTIEQDPIQRISVLLTGTSSTVGQDGSPKQSKSTAVDWAPKDLNAILLETDTPEPKTSSTVTLTLRNTTMTKVELNLDLHQQSGFRNHLLLRLTNRLKTWSLKFQIPSKISDQTVIEIPPPGEIFNRVKTPPGYREGVSSTMAIKIGPPPQSQSRQEVSNSPKKKKSTKNKGKGKEITTNTFEIQAPPPLPLPLPLPSSSSTTKDSKVGGKGKGKEQEQHTEEREVGKKVDGAAVQSKASKSKKPKSKEKGKGKEEGSVVVDETTTSTGGGGAATIKKSTTKANGTKRASSKPPKSKWYRIETESSSSSEGEGAGNKSKKRNSKRSKSIFEIEELVDPTGEGKRTRRQSTIRKSISYAEKGMESFEEEEEDAGEEEEEESYDENGNEHDPPSRKRKRQSSTSNRPRRSTSASVPIASTSKSLLTSNSKASKKRQSSAAPPGPKKKRTSTSTSSKRQKTNHRSPSPSSSLASEHSQDEEDSDSTTKKIAIPSQRSREKTCSPSPTPETTETERKRRSRSNRDLPRDVSDRVTEIENKFRALEDRLENSFDKRIEAISKVVWDKDKFKEISGSSNQEQEQGGGVNSTSSRDGRAWSTGGESLRHDVNFLTNNYEDLRARVMGLAEDIRVVKGLTGRIQVGRGIQDGARGGEIGIDRNDGEAQIENGDGMDIDGQHPLATETDSQELLRRIESLTKTASNFEKNLALVQTTASSALAQSEGSNARIDHLKKENAELLKRESERQVRDRQEKEKMVERMEKMEEMLKNLSEKAVLPPLPPLETQQHLFNPAASSSSSNQFSPPLPLPTIPSTSSSSAPQSRTSFRLAAALEKNLARRREATSSGGSPRTARSKSTSATSQAPRGDGKGKGSTRISQTPSAPPKAVPTAARESPYGTRRSLRSQTVDPTSYASAPFVTPPSPQQGSSARPVSAPQPQASTSNASPPPPSREGSPEIGFTAQDEAIFREIRELAGEGLSGDVGSQLRLLEKVRKGVLGSSE